MRRWLLLILAASVFLIAFRNAPGALRFSEMADGYAAEGLTEKALEYYSRAVGAEPENPLHYTTRGFFLLKQKRYDEALMDFSAAIRLAPGEPSGYLARGLVYCDLHQENEADADFLAACSLGSRDGCSFSGQK